MFVDDGLSDGTIIMSSRHSAKSNCNTAQEKKHIIVLFYGTYDICLAVQMENPLFAFKEFFGRFKDFQKQF